jgi:hypothetical protein
MGPPTQLIDPPVSASAKFGADRRLCRRVGTGGDDSEGRQAPRVGSPTRGGHILHPLSPVEDAELGSPFGRRPTLRTQELETSGAHAGEGRDTARGGDQAGRRPEPDDLAQVWDDLHREPFEIGRQPMMMLGELFPEPSPAFPVGDDPWVGPRSELEGGVLLSAQRSLDPFLLPGQQDEDLHWVAEGLFPPGVSEGEKETTFASIGRARDR